jgi:hypothetical protein
MGYKTKLQSVHLINSQVARRLNVFDQLKIDALVDLVVTRAKVDKTTPDSKNLRKGWRTDELLTGDVDLLVVGGDNPGAYAEIGRKALKQLQGLPERLPEMEALAMLAILRGERLLPLTPEQADLVIRLSEDLKIAISALPDGNRKRRCQELFLLLCKGPGTRTKQIR